MSTQTTELDSKDIAFPGVVSVQALLGPVIDRIHELSGRTVPAPLSGLSTGLAELDRATSGLQAGEMVVVAGRPGMGKSAFAMRVTEAVALEAGLPVVFFSMEMPATQLVMRFLSSVGRLDQHRLRTGKLGDDEWQRLSKALGALHEAPLFIDETAGINPVDLRERACRLHRQLGGKLGLIVIDYMQLMTAYKECDNRAAELAEISRSIKSLAQELNVPIMLLAQLNRSLEARADKRPITSDLRESGALEQDADLILFMYRDEIYHPDTKDRGSAELIIAKHRNGPTGMVPLAFIGEHVRFEDCDPSSPQNRNILMASAHIPPREARRADEASGCGANSEGLNASFTFDTLMQGKSNELALEAARSVANASATKFDPLLIYGAAGLGKTHLLHAIGNEVLRLDPKTKVRYVHAEEYFSDVIRAYQARNFDPFQRYYHSLDLLLMDDVDLLGVGNKQRTQEEFLNAFNALVRGQKNVVVSSSVSPKNIQGLDDRLLSRLCGGLSVQIESPELALRTAILKNKAEASGMKLPDDSALLIAEKICTDIRELEGAINKLGAYMRFNGLEASLETVRAALRDRIDFA